MINDAQARGSRNSVIQPELLTHLRSSYFKWGGVHLIPNIQQLSLSYSHPTTASLALLFPDPSLKTLHLLLGSSAGNVFSATRKVLMTLTAMRDTLKLQEFHIHCLSDGGHAVEFDSTFVNFIGSQPSISTLMLGFVINAGILSAILKAVSRLNTLSLGWLGHPPADALDTVSALISKLHPDLERFVYFNGWLHHRSTTGFHRPPVPRSLSECCNLKALTLWGVDPSSLDPSTIECWGRAWRKIERLDLLPASRSDHKVGISIALLQQITSTFGPSLRSLAIPITFEPWPTLTLPTSPVKLPALRVLKVGYSIIPKDNVHQFVEFLSAIIPLGITVEHSHGTDGEQGQNWKDVDDLLQMIQRIKKRTRSELLVE